jgi:NTP pyrophosphatase (non-canonical NTP hydrolase)
MEYNIDESIITKSIKHYGAEIQSTVCMEECAELIQAISKAKRGKFDENNMTEEIADVLICIEILKQIYNIPDCSIKNWIERKQKRILDRMEK